MGCWGEGAQTWRTGQDGEWGLQGGVPGGQEAERSNKPDSGPHAGGVSVGQHLTPATWPAASRPAPTEASATPARAAQRGHRRAGPGGAQRAASCRASVPHSLPVSRGDRARQRPPGCSSSPAAGGTKVCCALECFMKPTAVSRKSQCHLLLQPGRVTGPIPGLRCRSFGGAEGSPGGEGQKRCHVDLRPTRRRLGGPGELGGCSGFLSGSGSASVRGFRSQNLRTKAPPARAGCGGSRRPGSLGFVREPPPLHPSQCSLRLS